MKKNDEIKKWVQPDHTDRPPHSSWKRNTSLIVAIVITLAILLLSFSLLEILGSRQEMTHLLREQSKSLVAAIEEGGQNAVESFNLVESLLAERLLNNARLLEELDYAGRLTNSKLERFAKENNIYRINIYNSNMQRVQSSFMRRDDQHQDRPHENLLDIMNDKESDELVMGFRQSRFGGGDRFAVAKRRRRGGVIILNINADQVLNYRNSIGIGRLVRNLGETENVAYVAVQDKNQILVASRQIDSLTAVAGDSVLMSVLKRNQPSDRFIHYQGKPVFEAIYPFNPDTGELLRIGLQTKHLQEAKQKAIWRTGLAAVSLLLIGVVLANWVVGRQNYRMLQQAYTRIETYTGSILTHMTDAVIAVNDDLDVTLFNRAAESLFNVGAGATLNSPLRGLNPTLFSLFKHTLNSGEPIIAAEHRLTIENKPHICRLTINILRDERGSTEGAFAVIKDITEEKRLEQNLKRQDQITAMGHLAAGVAHEIRNPLNAISMLAQRFKTEFKPKAEIGKFDKMTGTLVSETRRINAIIDQFLEFARPTPLAPSRLRIPHIFKEVQPLIEQDISKHNIKMIIKCDHVPPVQGDADKLKQVILNLVRNSMDACSENDEISITCTNVSEQVLIQIQDTGSGINTENLNKIFNLYYTSKEKGTGIGLSVVQQIVSQHNGRIEVTSEPGTGTTFSIYLPATES
ncbi:MAG: ATP-binding protein [candidate division KSB1 bacterium]|nr:ATP-binding protein [candidate division KSB1 bacterium]